MNDTETSTVFAGIDGRTNATLPAWYERDHEPETVVSLAEAIRSLPRAVDTQVAFRNPYTGDWVETERFNALVEPNRLVEQAGDEETDPLFHIPTSNYSIINPLDVYGPLESVIDDHDVDGRPLGEVVFGEVRQYRGDGEVHIDLMFDGLEVSLPGRDEPITMGVMTGYDFFGGHAVYVEGFAQDTYCSNSIRSLTDRKVVKHVGEVGDFEGWWADVLGQLELVTDDLHQFIVDASEIDLSFSDAPFGVEAFNSTPSSAASCVTRLTKVVSSSNARFVGTRPSGTSLRGITFTLSPTRLTSTSSRLGSRMGTVNWP
jgi:hypothetical protein